MPWAYSQGIGTKETVQRSYEITTKAGLACEDRPTVKVAQDASDEDERDACKDKGNADTLEPKWPLRLGGCGRRFRCCHGFRHGRGYGSLDKLIERYPEQLGKSDEVLGIRQGLSALPA